MERIAETSTTFDGREIWERAEAAVTGKPLFDALAAFALNGTSLDVPELREHVEKDSERFAHMRLVPIVLHDYDGKPVKHVPPMGTDKAEEREAATRYHMVRRANWLQNLNGHAYVEPARCVIAAEHRVDVPDLLPFVHRSVFVPPGREW